MTTKLIELYKKPDRLLKCKVNDGTGHEYSDDSIYSIKLTSSFSNSSFSFGNTICKHIEIEFRNVDDVYFDDERFYVYVGINDGEGYTYTQLGVFFISDVSKDDNKIKIEAYDAMYKLEKKYGFVYPDRTLKPKELLQDILSESLLALEDESIIDSIFLSEYGDLSIPGFTSEKTIRQVLGCLVGIYGANAMITREGKLRIFTYKTSPVIEFDTNNYFKFEWDGYEHKVSEIDCQNGNETITLGSTTDDTLRMVMDNYLVSSSMFDSLTDKALWKKAILERGTKSQYVGYSMEWQGCPCLDIGDVVWHTDKKGVKRLIPILDYTLTYKGGLKCTMSAKGTSKLLNEYFKTGTIRGDIKRIENDIGNLYDTTQDISDKVDYIGEKLGVQTDYPWKDGFNLVKNSSFNLYYKNRVHGSRKDEYGNEYEDLKFVELSDWYYPQRRAINSSYYETPAKVVMASGENDYPKLKGATWSEVENSYTDKGDTLGYTMYGRLLHAINAHGMSISGNTDYENLTDEEKELISGTEQPIYQKIKENFTIPAGTKIYLCYHVKTYRKEKETYIDRDFIDEISCDILPGTSDIDDLVRVNVEPGIINEENKIIQLKYVNQPYRIIDRDDYLHCEVNTPDFEKLNNWHNVKKVFEVTEDVKDGFYVVIAKMYNVPTFIDYISVSIDIPNNEDVIDDTDDKIDEVGQNIIDVEDQVDTNAADIIYLQENKQDISKVYSSYDFTEGNICGDIATDGNIHITENNKSNIFVTYYVGDPGDTKNKVYIDIDYSTYNVADSYYFMLLIKHYPHSQSFVDYAGNPIDSLNNYNWKTDTLYYLLKDSYDNDNKTWSYKVVPVNSQDIDLSNYYDKDEINNKLTKYYTKEDVYTQEEISNILEDYYTSVQIDNKFNDLSNSFQTKKVEIIDGENVLGAYGKTIYNNSDTDIAMTINHKRDYASAIGYQTPEGSQYELGSYVIFDKYNKLNRTYGDEYSIEYRQPTIFNENVKFLGKIEGDITPSDCYTKAEVDSKLNGKADKCKKITFLSTDFNSNELTITHNLATTDVDCVVINENNRRELCKLTIVDENNIKITNDRAFNGAIIINKI